MTEEPKQFIFYDSDYIKSPLGWLETRLQNKFKDGYEIWRDEKEMAWKGVKH
jgi:hypothetical protein